MDEEEPGALVADWDLSAAAAYCAPVADNTNLKRLLDILHKPVVLNAKKQRRKAAEEQEEKPVLPVDSAVPAQAKIRKQKEKQPKETNAGLRVEQEVPQSAGGDGAKNQGKNEKQKASKGQQLVEGRQQDASASGGEQQQQQQQQQQEKEPQQAGGRKRKSKAVDVNSAEGQAHVEQQQQQQQQEVAAADLGAVKTGKRNKKQKREAAGGKDGGEHAQVLNQQDQQQQQAGQQAPEGGQPPSQGGKKEKQRKAPGQHSKEHEEMLKQKLKQKWEQRQQKLAGAKPAAAVAEPGHGGDPVEQGSASSQEAVRPKEGTSAPAGQAHKSDDALEKTPKPKASRQSSGGPGAQSVTPSGAAPAAAKVPAGKAASAAKPAAAAAAAERAERGSKSASKAPGAAASSSVIDKMMARLQGGRFRSLNEQLYTQSGADALSMMQDEPGLFQHYHDGFQQQTLGWPKLPVDVAVKWLGTLPPSLVVADFGCGDAKLMKSVKQKVHSFDLVSSAPGVIACNMADVPLESSSVDVAVFSLALMGTDYGGFIDEACRVLKPGGWLWIAEVRSRFSSADGKESFKPFLACLSQLGFKLTNQDAGNKMFVTWVLKKQPEAKGPSGKVPWPPLKACVYKRR